MSFKKSSVYGVLSMASFLLGILPLSLEAQAAVGATACPIEFKKAALCAELVWTVAPKKTEMPTEKDKAEFTLRVFQKAKKGTTLKPGDTLTAKLFMPSMGHGSMPTQVEEMRDEQGNVMLGSFRVKDVYFSMPGKWEIRLDLKRGEKLIDRAVSPYSL